ncbi:hypothetical protein UPYG_G00201280 [Umbra pygmaea]|uniref:Protein NPAT C-terminal domain-containing protein n=1 Tax=Umbra pygmaea TaxID=75934 RepID=A0ABD0WIM5_UMBPY
MLLPSDIARLVLGYLQQEGLCCTSQAFIRESPNLKEYAEHSSEDGTIPACVFSLFGKNLTTILNEYVAVKAKETCEETQIPAMMTSLWKKLDFTLNQIKSMHNSPAVIQNQRLRTRNGIANLRGRQRALSSTQSPTTGCLALSASQSAQSSASQLHSPQSILGHTTQVCYTSQQTRPSPICSAQPQIQDGGRLLINVTRESPLQIMVPDNRLTQGPLSPVRRKGDSPRRRVGGSAGATGTGRVKGTTEACNLTAEPQSEEAVTENFPQMVIQNARERILNDKSLQEKLAENINKILASDGSPQTSKASCSTMEPDQSIDEILGLQGEIHMSNDAIQDILEQTESDPAFQALFDLFDYGKSKTSEDNEGVGRNSTTWSAETEARCFDSFPEAGDPGTGTEPSTCQQVTTTRSGNSKSSQEPKNKNTRKSGPPVSSTSKSISGPVTRASRRGATTTRLSACNDQLAGPAASATKTSERVDVTIDFNPDVSGMDVEPVNTAPSETMSSHVLEQVGQEDTPTSSELGGTCPQVSTCNAASPKSRTLPALRKQSEIKNALPAINGIPMDTQDSLLNSPPALVISMPAMDETTKVSTQSSNPYSTVSSPSSEVISQPQPQNVTSTAVPAKVTTTTTSAPQTLTANPPGKDVDPSKIVALKIIISDDQEEPPSDSALNQAVSSITGDKIPTIFLSSPNKSPATAAPLCSASMAQEETVQAVSSLQRTEVLQPVETSNLREKAGMPAAPSGTSSAWTPPSYYIQLPFDSAAYGGATSSYFLVTDTTATDPQSNKVIIPSGSPQVQTVPTTPYTLATPPRYSPGSRLIISSPVQSMLQNLVVPVSVVGQNNAGQFSVVANQLIAMPSPAPVNQASAVNAKSKLAPKDTTVSSQTKASGSNEITKPVHPQACASAGQQSAAVVSSHRRMLCFDGSAGETSTQTRQTVSSIKAPETGPPVSSSVQQAEKQNPTLASVKPAIVGNSRPKRRIETVRCTDNTQTSWTRTETEKSTTVQQQKEAVKNTPSKKKADQSPRGRSASSSRSQSTSSHKTDASLSKSSRNAKSVRSKSADKKDDDGGTECKDAQSSRASSCDHKLRSGSRKEKEVESTQDPAAKCPVEEHGGQTERNTPQTPPSTMANKENELEVCSRDLQSTPGPRDASPSQAGSQTPVPQASSSKTPSKTSPLTKQAAEMLHDIQGLNPPSTPSKRPGMGCPELPLPRTPGHLQRDSLDCHRTPTRHRHGREGEGTPRHRNPPATPDLPSCSPASEAGSESSINMAAHTLMILSRAAIARTGTPLKARTGTPLKARTGTPLKASLHQVGAGEITPGSKNKKRKHSEHLASPPVKRDQSGSSGSKKKAKKQKKLLDSFPDDLDVDKFLSSLHYDE